MIEVQREIGRPIAAQMYVAVNLQFCVFKLRAADDTRPRTLRRRVNGEVTGKFMIEGEIVKIECSLDDRFFERSGANRSKAHPALDGHTAAWEGAYSREVKICSCRIQTE